MTSTNLNIYALSAIGLVLILFGYSVLVHRCAKKESNSNIWNWYHRLVSTIVSVGLGVIITIATFNCQQNDIRNTRKIAIDKMLHAELKDNRLALEANDRKVEISAGGQNASVRATRMTTVASEAAMQSGLIPLEINKKLLGLYREMIQYNMFVDFFISLNDPSNAGPDFPNRAKVFADAVEGYRAKILIQSMELEKYFEAE